MSFTLHQQLETQTSGQADWDTGLNSNMSILERGFHAKKIAGTAISTGQACTINNSNYVVPFNAASDSNRLPNCLAYTASSSGDMASFVLYGNVNSMVVWSGHLIPGSPVYVNPSSIGWLTSSRFTGHGESVGIALDFDAVHFRPGYPQTFPRLETVTRTTATEVARSSNSNFSLGGIHRGICRRLTAISSHNAYKVQIWSNSTRAASELLYETLTHSTSIGSVDINSTYYQDSDPFPWYSTNTSSLGLVYCTVSAQSGSAVGSAFITILADVERFR